MPTYEYECTKCGQRLEKFQQMSDERLKKCPECGGKLNRLIGTGAGIILKGSSSPSPDEYSGTATTSRCGTRAPCCGRETPCDTPPCEG